jgi:hypothetical protein
MKGMLDENPTTKAAQADEALISGCPLGVAKAPGSYGLAR